MSRKAFARNHAMYLPTPPPDRSPTRCHATLVARPQPPRTVRRRPVMSVTLPGHDTTVMTYRRTGVLGILCPGAVLLAALGNTFAGLLFGLSTLLQYTLQGPIRAAVFPLLLGGTLLILARGHIGAKTYWSLRRHVGLTTGHWTDHALALLYFASLFLALAVVATLLALGGTVVVGALVG